MKKIIAAWNWFYFAIGVTLLLYVPFFVNYIGALIDPAAHNYRINNLKGEAVDAYLKTAEINISAIFATLGFLFLVYLLLELILKKKSAHIVPVMIGTVLMIAYTIARIIYCFDKGSTSIVVGIFYLAALIAEIGAGYFFLKKAWDGDNLWPYWACFIAAMAFFAFGSATSSSYSIFNMNNHNGDLTYWMGFATTRYYLIIFALCCAVNAKSDYDPEEIALVPAGETK